MTSQSSQRNFAVGIIAKLFLCALIIPLCLSAYAQTKFPDGLPDHIVGDIGGAVYTSNLHIGTEGTQSLALPYAFFDYQHFFARIDEVGIKTFQLGYGYFEIVGKISLDSYKIKSPINGQSINKADPIPLGIGTLQETPFGSIFLNAFQDFGKSKGALYEILYFGEIETLKKITLYPEVGIERQSSQYVNYYYGLSQGDAQLTGYNAYTAAASNNLLAGILIEIPIIDNWYVNVYAKRKWMGSGINNSPVMNKTFQDNVFAALAYRFK